MNGLDVGTGMNIATDMQNDDVEDWWIGECLIDMKEM